jgi:hypothetical protein
MEQRILLVEDDAEFRGVFTRAMSLALAPSNLTLRLWRRALWPRHARGCGRVGLTPR